MQNYNSVDMDRLFSNEIFLAAESVAFLLSFQRLLPMLQAMALCLFVPSFPVDKPAPSCLDFLNDRAIGGGNWFGNYQT